MSSLSSRILVEKLDMTYSPRVLPLENISEDFRDVFNLQPRILWKHIYSYFKTMYKAKELQVSLKMATNKSNILELVRT